MCPTMLDNANMFLSRALNIVDGGAVQAGAVCVRLGKPVQEPGGEWSCAYSVTGLPDKKIVPTGLTLTSGSSTWRRRRDRLIPYPYRA